MDRRDVNNTTEFLGAHRRQCRRDQMKCRRQVDRQYGIPLLFWELFHRCYIVEQFPEEQWNAVLAVNLSSAFHLIASALPSMRAQKFGRIINISSVHGLVGSIHKSAYVAAKHGLVGLTKVVALETAGQGITCNAICPGWVLTPLVQRQIEAKAKKEGVDLETATQRLLDERQPSGIFTTIPQIGALAVFLCSESADNLTGASLPVDGGWLAQ